MLRRAPLLVALSILGAAITPFLHPADSPKPDSLTNPPASSAPSAQSAVSSPTTVSPSAKSAPSAVNPAPATDPLADITRLHKVSVSISTSEMTVLEQDTYVLRGRGGFGGGPITTEDDILNKEGRYIHIGGGFGGYFPWVHGDVSFDGGPPVKDAGIRFKGNGSYNPGAGLHRNLKVKTDFFGGKGAWGGMQTLNFNAGGRDGSRLRETMAFAVFRAAGVPASHTAYAELSYNVPGEYKDAYGGIFTVIENVNKTFLKRALPPGTGLLMKPERMNGGVGYYGESWSQYVPIYRPEREATPAEQKRVIEFARLVNTGSVDDFRARIASYLDVDEFLRFLAVNALIMSRDSYLTGRHNYFIYLDPKDNKFRFIPWDEDGALAGGNFGGGGFPDNILAPWSGDNPLAYWLLDDPAVKKRYQAIVRDIIAKVFNRADLLKMVDSLEPVVRDPLVKEATAMMIRSEYNNPGGGPPPRTWVEERVAAVDLQLSTWPK